MQKMLAHCTPDQLAAGWDALYQWAEETLSVEGQELCVSLMLEPNGALVDDLADEMASDERAYFEIDGGAETTALSAQIAEHYDWALALDWDAKPECARVWYTSEEKLEPRLGERFEEPIEAYEQPLSPARDIVRLHRDLEGTDDSVAGFLMKHPEHRHAVRRVQTVAKAPYSEIYDNTISERVLPIDMLRCKLAFFGATHFDPRSDRWVRISMYKGAPYPEELQGADEYWVYPEGVA